MPVVLCGEMALAVVEIGGVVLGVVFGAEVAAVVVVVLLLEGARGALAGDVPMVCTAVLEGDLDAAGTAAFAGACPETVPETQGASRFAVEGAVV
jgi:hypothetical protein